MSIELEGSVFRIIYQKDNYIIATIKNEYDEQFKIKGNVEIPVELQDHISGKFDRIESKYGIDYDAKQYGTISVDDPKYEDAITQRLKILMEQAYVKSGKRIQREIAELRKSNNIWNALSDMKESDVSTSMWEIKKAYDKYEERMNSKGLVSVVKYLRNIGISWTESSIKTILGFKKDCECPDTMPITKEDLQDDPLYILDIKNGKLNKKQFDEYINALYEIKVLDPESYNMCKLLSAVREKESEGHTHIPTRLINMEIVSTNRIFKRFLYLYKDNLYRKETYDKEFMISKTIADLISDHPLSDFHRKDLLNDIKSMPPDTMIIPTEEQCIAVYKMLTERMQIIIGSAGTGKTTTLRLLLRMYRKYYPSYNNSIMLLAPTGKAVNRIRESTEDLYNCDTIYKDVKPSIDTIQTIHRFAYAVKGYYMNRNIADKPIYLSSGIRMVVVDEMSMVDNSTFYLLMDALQTICKEEHIEMPHIVLLGDISQLGPIGCGFPLKAFLDSEIIPVHILEVIKRQGSESAIMNVLMKIRNYNVPTILNDSSDISMYQFTDKSLQDMIIKWLDKQPDYKYGEKATIICPTNNLCQTITKIARDYINPMNELLSVIDGKTLRYSNADWGTIRVGDKVIQLKNNYSQNVFNGTVGRVISIERDQKEGEVMQLYAKVAFPNQATRSYSQSEIFDEIDLAYALTVHKAQGSEYDGVLFVIENSPRFITGNLIYTALSRGKKNVTVMIKGLDAWDQCRIKPSIRRTNIPNMIESFVEFE